MDLIGTAVRAGVAYVVLLFLVRATGRQSLKHGTTVEFVIALVIGDMVDNAIWAEVSMVKFTVAVVTLFVTHWSFEYANYRARGHHPYEGYR